MRKRFFTVALIAVLGTIATGCQKETMADVQGTLVESSSVYTVQYAIDGVLHKETLPDEKTCNALMERLMALARAGSHVEFFSNNGSCLPTKEIVRFTTDNQKEATEWTKKMMKEGYDVVVTYDEKDKVFNCVAYR